jgi:hypothetical protein
MEYWQNDISGSINPIKWSFKDEIGEELSEDDDVGLDSMLLDYFRACFPPNAVKNSKKLHDNKQAQMGMGELLEVFGVLILTT